LFLRRPVRPAPIRCPLCRARDLRSSWPRPGDLDTTEVVLVVDRGILDGLVARKYLRPTHRSTKTAIGVAIEDCLEHALGLTDKVESY
jgi:hypothetical protein